MKVDLSPVGGAGARSPVAPTDEAAAVKHEPPQEQSRALPPTQPAQEEPTARGAEVQALVEKVNVAARILHTNLRFQVSEETNQLVVHVVDASTGRVVRTIPPEKLAEAYDSLQALVGLLLDVKI